METGYPGNWLSWNPVIVETGYRGNWLSWNPVIVETGHSGNRLSSKLVIVISCVAAFHTCEKYFLIRPRMHPKIVQE